MKIKHLLLATTPIMATAAIAAPLLTGCSSNLTTLNLDNNEFEGYKCFSITGNFNKDTNYEFVADMNKWDTEHTKPTEQEWSEVEYVYFKMWIAEFPTITLTNPDNVKMICDGRTLKKGTREQVEAGEADWYMEFETEYAYFFHIRTQNDNPVKYTSTVRLQNIQFSESYENLRIQYDSDY